MNSNRTRYASTPTYGMQKRNFMKKPAAARQASQTPDFSQAPDPFSGMPFQQPVVSQPMMQQPVQQAMPQGGYMPGASFYPGNAQGMSGMQAPQPMPFATPTFVQSGMPLPPMQNAMPQPMAQPLGNSVPPMSSSHFSSRAQGFVPPQAAPVQTPRPSVQPASAPFQQPFAAQPQQSMPPFGGMQTAQPVFGYQNAPAQQQSIPFSPVMQSNAPQQPRAPREPMNADKLWTLFLFGLLPLLLIPCLFVTGIWGFIRYVFIGTVVIGLGAMWYRQMYTPTTRLIVSMVYVALCIGSIAMQMQASADVRQTSANMVGQNPAVSQQQAAAVPEAEPTPEPIQPTATPLPVSGPSEAEKRLELFMSLWSVNNTTEMVQLVQPSWCSKQENPSMALFMVLANRTPEDFKIEDISGSDTDNSRTVTMRATINKNNGKASSVYRFMIMMVKEGEEWYVNPNSLATNDKQAAATDENVVKTQSVGTATEAPRTTVTPAPPASTTLYYNMGGNYYHMDPNCPSVNADNLPFDSSFRYSELKDIKSSTNLLPCLKCGAPVNTLEDAVQ